MPNDSDTELQWAGAAMDFEGDGGVLGSLTWWLTGGASLLVWTGLALLLTSA